MNSSQTMPQPKSRPPRPRVTRTLRRQIMRLIVPVVILPVLLVPLVFTLSNRAQIFASIQETQVSTVTAIQSEINNAFRTAANDVLNAANGREARAFARRTLVNVTGEALETAQQALLASFIGLMERNEASYLAIRYVTYTGSIWTEATNYDGEGAIPDSGVRFNELQDDLGVGGALASPLGEVVLSDIDYRRSATDVGADRLLPYIRFTSPVATENDVDNIAGVVQLDLLASPLTDFLASLANAATLDLPARRILIVDTQGRLLADTGSQGRDFVRDIAVNNATTLAENVPAAARLFETDAGSGEAATTPIIHRAVEQDGLLFTTGNITLGELGAPFWRIVLLDDAAQINLELLRGTLFIMGISLAIGALICGAIYWILGRVLTPVGEMSEVAHRWVTQAAQGRNPETGAHAHTPRAQTELLSQGLATHASDDSEVASMFSAFSTMSARVESLQDEAEMQTGRYKRNLDIAARIGRETATLYEVDVLLNRVIRLIVDEYNFYHAQVFLIDDVRRNAVLVYSHGDTGAQLLAQGHKLAIGSSSVIGRVTATGQPVVVNDTISREELHQFNPLLPETRAEMALPLQIGDVIIGALDVQSRDPNAFREDEVRTFQLLADQIAVAIQNARLLVESRDRYQQIDQLNRQLTQKAWAETGAQEGLASAYHYDLVTVERDESMPSVETAPPVEQVTLQTIQMPITIRGEVIGVLDANNDGDREFSLGDEAVMRAVADRVAIAIERARLFEETQTSLGETSTLYELSRALNKAESLAEIVRAIILSVMPDAIGGQIGVFDGYTAGEAPGWMQITAEYIRDESAPQEIQLHGLQINVANHPVLRAMKPDTVSIIADVDTDLLVDPIIKTITYDLGARSMVFIPFSVRAQWRGIIIIQFAEPRAFSIRERRIYAALIDQAGVAIDNRMLLQQNEESLSQIERLYTASRNINMAQSAQDLVRAALSTAEDTDRSFLLAVLEGEIDEATGWRGGLRAAAYSAGGDVLPDDRLYTVPLGEDSPLRKREPQIIQDRNPNAPEHSPFLQLLRDHGAVFGAAFPLYSANTPIALFFILDRQPRDLTPEDYEVYRALTGQMSTVLQNRRLLEQTEEDRSRVRSILQTLPAGVLVLDPVTFIPVQVNDQMAILLGRPVDMESPFSAQAYGLVRTDSGVAYEQEDLPIYAAAQTGELATSEDVSIHIDGSHLVDLLINAAPILDAQGNITAIVAAFQNISQLRGLEALLQNNLSETIALYEAARALSDAESADDVFDQVIKQTLAQSPLETQLALLDEAQGGAIVVRSLSGYTGAYQLPNELLAAIDVRFAGDLDQATLSDAGRATLQTMGVASFATLPLRTRTHREVPLGWLIVLFSQPQDFTSERQQFLTTLTDNAAIALDNRNLFRGTEQALEETAALYRAATTISRSRELTGLSSALETAVESLNPDVYAAYLLNAGELVELFNISMDDAPAPLHDLIVREDLARNANTVFIDDLRSISEPSRFERDLMNVGNIRSVAMMPLRVQGQTGGLLLLGYHEPRRFDTGVARYLSAIADSTSVVADNILLFSEVQNTLRETNTLYQASRSLSDVATTDGIITALVSNLLNHPVNFAFLALLSGEGWDHPNAMIQIVSSWQSDGENSMNLLGITLTREQYPAWRLLGSPNVLTIDDILTEAGIDEMEQAGIASFDLRSFSVLPLRVAGRIIGALGFGSREPYAHTERDLRIYRAFAEQASLRMEASRLLEQTERRAQQLSTSAEVSRIAASILNLDALLPRIVDLIRETFRYDHVQIFMMDENDDFAVLRASTGDAGRHLLGNGHKLQKGSTSVIGQVTASGTPTVASDTADARALHLPNPYLPNTRSEMALPLILKGRVVGALDVQSNQPNTFDEDDVAVLTTLAAQVSVAIDNAQLYNQSQTRANEMSFLFNVTTAAASADTLDQALQNVAKELRDSLNALSVSLYLPETYRNAENVPRIVLRPAALAGAGEILQPLSELSEVGMDDASSLIASVAANRQPLILDDIEQTPRYLPMVEGARSAILVPLISGSQLVGLIAAESEHIGAYDDNTLTLLLTLAGTLSAIVQNQQLLETVTQTNEQLRELDRLKNDFLANMSHELRTPLNSIIGFSRVILKGIDGPLTEMQEQDLATIYNSGLHLLNLINDILDQAKIAAGKMDLQADYFDMKSVIDGVRAIGIGLVKDKTIEIVVQIAPGLPRAHGDEFRTRQILLNLVSNAAKFTREGTIRIDVYPTTQTHDDGMVHPMLRVDVIDTGIGIAEQDLPLLFEEFRQIDSSLTRTQGGTGLGLPIAKSLIEMQGGSMRVESQVNIGSTFSILIPTEPGLAPVDGALSGARKAPAGLPTKDKSHLNLTPTQLPSAMQTRASHANGGSGNGHADGGFDPKEDTGVIAENGQLRPPGARKMQTTELSLPRPMLVKRQILLIEDNPDRVDQLRRSLGREGFDIFTASIPLEAEAMASGLHPTVIIMDSGFANGAGWDIIARLKQRDDTMDIPVIVVSLTDESERATAHNIFQLIRRPFVPEDVVKAVHDAEQESRIERILIIDDQPDSARLLQQLLDEQGGYRIFSAKSGIEGIGLVARRRPNLILLDLRMPDMDGFAVIEELRSNPETATIPILVVTGESLTAEEAVRLQNLHVIYKTDISADRVRPLVDGVKSHLHGASGR